MAPESRSKSGSGFRYVRVPMYTHRVIDVGCMDQNVLLLTQLRCPVRKHQDVYNSHRRTFGSNNILTSDFRIFRRLSTSLVDRISRVETFPSQTCCVV